MAHPVGGIPAFPPPPTAVSDRVPVGIRRTRWDDEPPPFSPVAPVADAVPHWATETVYSPADRRREVIRRMVQMNFEHARVAWQMRRKDPIEPYGVAQLFAQPDERPYRVGQERIGAATRLWLAGVGARDLPEHLFRYAGGLAARLAGVADIRAEANRRDREMIDGAEYVGVGVSSLDTAAGPWTHMVRELSDDAQVAPGRIWIVLTDGTVMFIERGGTAALNQQTVHTTASLDYAPGNPPYTYRYTTLDTLHTDPLHHGVLHWLDEINSMFWSTDWDRLTALHGGVR